MRSKAAKNGANSILMTDFSSATSKTPITEVSPKSNEFDQLTQKHALTNKGILANLEISKIFTKFPIPT